MSAAHIGGVSGMNEACGAVVRVSVWKLFQESGGGLPGLHSSEGHPTTFVTAFFCLFLGISEHLPEAHPGRSSVGVK